MKRYFVIREQRSSEVAFRYESLDQAMRVASEGASRVGSLYEVCEVVAIVRPSEPAPPPPPEVIELEP